MYVRTHPQYFHLLQGQVSITPVTVQGRPLGEPVEFCEGEYGVVPSVSCYHVCVCVCVCLYVYVYVAHGEDEGEYGVVPLICSYHVCVCVCMCMWLTARASTD